MAKTCVSSLGLEMIPAVLDKIDDKVNQAYAAHPDRLYLVGKDGKIAYASGRGPFGFKPEELRDAILVATGKKTEVAGTEPAAPSREGRGGPGGGGFRPGGGFRSPVMAALDADQDGEISAEELENAAAALKGLDKDKNGELTPDELRPNFGGRGGFGGGRGQGGPGGREGGDRPQRPARPDTEV